MVRMFIWTRQNPDSVNADGLTDRASGEPEPVVRGHLGQLLAVVLAGYATSKSRWDSLTQGN